jgi:hypothetical protein
MFEWIKNLALDRWYKLCIAFGIVGFFIALLIPVKTTILSNNGLAIFSFGLFLIGIGEWMKWHLRMDSSASGGTIAYMEKVPDGHEYVVQLVGILLIIISIFLSIV